MKAVFFGGGAHRYLGIGRSALEVPGLLAGGELHLYDLNVPRAKVVGRLLARCPEHVGADCRVTWGDDLDRALDGADVVFVVLMAGSRRNHGLCELVCREHGFLGSDQLSPSGAMLALKGGPVLLDVAQRMERLCPQAWLVDFANPVAVLSAAVNNHTRVRCLGVCGGFTNHQWDLTRILYGRDEQWSDYHIRCAGVNHLSFILRGSTHRGRDLYELAAERLGADWAPAPLSDRWNEGTKANIGRAMATLRSLWQRFGWLVFSTEGDGLDHLDIERSHQRLDPVTVSAQRARHAADTGPDTGRAEADRRFAAWLDRELTTADWDTARPETLDLLRCDEDIMVKVLRALGGGEELAIATSFPSRGAVAGFKDRTVLEYSQTLSAAGLRPDAALEVPDVFQGLIGALAGHQTLLGDAIATRDPRVLAHALYSYPVQQDTAAAKALWRELLALAAPEIAPEYQAAREWF